MDENINKIFNRKHQKNLRQELRKTTSPIERLLWEKIRNQQLGVKFRRQHGIGPYIVDFYCPEINLVVELDGHSHYEIGAQDYDCRRDEFMQSLGLQIVRFTNTEVMHNIEGVVVSLCEKIKQTPPQPSP